MKEANFTCKLCDKMLVYDDGPWFLPDDTDRSEPNFAWRCQHIGYYYRLYCLGDMTTITDEIITVGDISLIVWRYKPAQIKRRDTPNSGWKLVDTLPSIIKLTPALAQQWLAKLKMYGVFQ